MANVCTNYPITAGAIVELLAVRVYSIKVPKTFSISGDSLVNGNVENS